MSWYTCLETYFCDEFDLNSMGEDSAYAAALKELEMDSSQIIRSYVERALVPARQECENYTHFADLYENPEETILDYLQIGNEENFDFVMSSANYSERLNDFMLFQSRANYQLNAHGDVTKKIASFRKVFVSNYEKHLDLKKQFKKALHTGGLSYTFLQKIISNNLYALCKVFLAQQNIYQTEIRLIDLMDPIIAPELKKMFAENTKERENTQKAVKQFLDAMKDRGFELPEDKDYHSDEFVNAIRSEHKEYRDLLSGEIESIEHILAILAWTIKTLRYPIIFQ